jgi:CHAT domain-containing protein
MPDGTALLMLVATSARTVAFVLRPGSEPASVTAGLSRQDWSALAGQLFEEMASEEPGPEPDAWLKPVVALLRKAQAHLTGAIRLVIVPDGAGHLVPWSVVSRAAGLVLPGGEPVPVVVLPSLALLPRLRSRAAALEGLSRRRAMVAGNPTGDLSRAEEEATRVAKRLGTAPMLRSDATRMETVVRLGEFSAIHLAAHASFHRGSPLDSGIIFSDGVLSARDAIVGELSVDLLVLSGCQTGVAHGVTGEELANLAHGFLAAGARSMMVTLWEVDDVSTAQLMDSFYEARQNGQDKAQALATAMERVRLQADYADPYFWGGVILLGDWE